MSSSSPGPPRPAPRAPPSCPSAPAAASWPSPGAIPSRRNPSPRGETHPLAAKPILSWKDLAGETLLLLREGESPVVDAIRADIRRNRRPVRMLDFDGYYDMSVFNRCAQQGWLMELPELCSGIHPSLVTRPVRWSCRFPLGLMHRADPPRPVQDFLDAVRRENEIRPFRLR